MSFTWTVRRVPIAVLRVRHLLQLSVLFSIYRSDTTLSVLFSLYRSDTTRSRTQYPTNNTSVCINPDMTHRSMYSLVCIIQIQLALELNVLQ